LAASPLAGDTYQRSSRHPSNPHRDARHSHSSLAAGLIVHALCKMSRPLSLFSVQAILVLAIDDGSRILTKYYSNPHPPAGVHNDFPGQIAYKTVKDQKAFEKGLLGALRADNAAWVVV
jgi:hypothetical protein